MTSWKYCTTETAIRQYTICVVRKLKFLQQHLDDMGRDLALILMGATIALGSSLLTVLIQHILHLRAEKIRRKLDAEEKAAQELREKLLEGSDVHLSLVKEKVILLSARYSKLINLEDLRKGTDMEARVNIEDAIKFLQTIRELPRKALPEPTTPKDSD